MNQDSGFNKNPYSGVNNTFNNNSTVITQQPEMDIGHRRTTIDLPFDWTWYDKTSPNGEFKYGLFKCCEGPSGSQGILAIISCFIPLLGWAYMGKINGNVADVVGKCLFF